MCTDSCVREDFIEKMTFEQRHEGGEGVSLRLSAGIVFQAEGIACIEAWRQGYAWHAKD